MVDRLIIPRGLARSRGELKNSSASKVELQLLPLPVYNDSNASGEKPPVAKFREKEFGPSRRRIGLAYRFFRFDLPLTHTAVLHSPFTRFVTVEGEHFEG